jgi:hypothetical protein
MMTTVLTSRSSGGGGGGAGKWLLFPAAELGIDEHGDMFVKEKVKKIDSDDQDATTNKTTTTTTTTTTSGSIFQKDFSCCISPSLSDDPWHCERAVRPSKQQQDLLARKAIMNEQEK